MATDSPQSQAQPPAEPSLSSAYGLGLRLHFPLPGFPPRPAPAGTPLVDVCAVGQDELLDRWSGGALATVWETVLDGAGYRLTRGGAGDHLFEYPSRAAFHLTADGLSLACSDPGTKTADWRRTLTDTVLWSVALLHGRSLLHASAVAGPDGVVAIAAARGGGKSSVAAALALGGWPLVTDDILAFEACGERVIVSPGPALMNLAAAPDSVPDPAALGDILDVFGGEECPEAWVRVHGCASAELPLAAVVLPVRSASAGLLARRSAAPLTLVAHTLAFRSMDGALRHRFEAVGDLVERIPVFCIQVGVDVSPFELAAALRLPTTGQSPDHAAAVHRGSC